MPDEEKAEVFKLLDQLYPDQATAIEALYRAIDYVKTLKFEHRILPILKSRSDRLEQCWSQCEELNQSICSYATQAGTNQGSYFTEKQFQNAEVEYISAKDQVAIWTHAANPPTRQLTDRLVGAEINVNLPRLSIPSFSGQLTEWVPFRDSFTALVRSNASLSDIEKLHYVKACVKGEASEIIRNVQLAHGNFNTAWTLLEARYENNRIATSAHFSEILKIEPIKKESASSLLYLRNTVQRNLAALQNLGCPTQYYGAIIIHILTEKLDPQTQRDWEVSIASTTTLPQYDTFDKFLLERIRVLESLGQAEFQKRNVHSNQKQVSNQSQNRYDKSKHMEVTSYIVTQPGLCPVCDSDHKIYGCSKFAGMSVTDRFDQVRSLNLCLNCLGKRHKSIDCQSSGSCRKCKKKHHTMLHRETPYQNNSNNENSPAQGQTHPIADNPIQTHISIQRPLQSQKVLLATARVWVSSHTGRKIQVRALLDQGSTWSFLSHKVAVALGSPLSNIAASMTGLGGTPAGSTSHAINIKLFNQTHQLVCQTQALVLPTITSYSAHAPGPLTKWTHLKGLNFADDLSATDEIQLLIGADLYGSILLNKIRKGRINEPVAQQTVFGWVVLGPCSNVNPTIELSVPVHHSIAVNDLDQLLQRFWEVESLPQQPIISPADEECEMHFLKTHSRTNEGQYVVRIPFKFNMAPQVGQSRSIAERLLKKVETRLSYNPAHQLLYSEFMNDYESLGHMTRVDSGQSNKSSIIYIPHHPIIRDQNPTTRLKVVYNASCKTSNGNLNSSSS
ncbi:uncharacterized protein LOC106644423 [Copidosoma floridanum]|uniref:uncharacterized protein LOC106644423 n=1 Tax=Copidosoma floridanum TaxID=29053 RepID=UPI0006C9865B|nr:uncharacterized protein LOC106644423 [Copidosoma floridanum]